MDFFDTIATLPNKRQRIMPNGPPDVGPLTQSKQVSYIRTHSDLFEHQYIFMDRFTTTQQGAAAEVYYCPGEREKTEKLLHSISLHYTSQEKIDKMSSFPKPVAQAKCGVCFLASILPLYFDFTYVCREAAPARNCDQCNRKTCLDCDECIFRLKLKNSSVD